MKRKHNDITNPQITQRKRFAKELPQEWDENSMKRLSGKIRFKGETLKEIVLNNRIYEDGNMLMSKLKIEEDFGKL